MKSDFIFFFQKEEEKVAAAAAESFNSHALILSDFGKFKQKGHLTTVVTDLNFSIWFLKEGKRESDLTSSAFD